MFGVAARGLAEASERGGAELDSAQGGTNLLCLAIRAGEESRLVVRISRRRINHERLDLIR